jgi:predicted phosphodiesterase
MRQTRYYFSTPRSYVGYLFFTVSTPLAVNLVVYIVADTIPLSSVVGITCICYHSVMTLSFNEVVEQVENKKITKAAGARILGIPPSTFKDRLERIKLGPNYESDGLDHDANPDEIPIFTIDHSDKAKLSLYPIGDVHKGAAQHLEGLFQQWLRYLRDTDDVAAIFTGDGFNAAIPGSKSDPFEEKYSLDEAVDRLAADLNIAKDKIDAAIAGNHDIRAYKLTSLDPMKFLADKLGIEAYDQTSLLLHYIVGDQTYDIYLRHGTGNPASIGGMTNQMKASRDTVMADIYITGHTHKQLAFPLDIFVPDYSGPVPTMTRKKQFFVSSGSFVGYERYAQERGWSPTHPGAPRIYLDGTRNDIHVSL